MCSEGQKRSEGQKCSEGQKRSEGQKCSEGHFCTPNEKITLLVKIFYFLSDPAANNFISSAMTQEFQICA